MNILIITQSLSGGGAEKLAANLSLELSKNNRVFITTYQREKSEYPFAGECICIDKFGGQGGILKHVFNAVERIKLIKRIKKQHQIDYSISFLPQTDYANVFSRIKNEKIIIDVVSNMSIVYPSGIKHLFRKFVMKKADYVVTVSEGVRQDLINNFDISAVKSRAIYNSIDLKAISDDCATQKEYKRLFAGLPQNYICSMGSFRKAKGHWHLIKAFSYIKDRIPDIDLVILGDGQYRRQYENLICNLGIENRVVMPGFANPPYSVVAHSKLFVFSSVFEGFGHSVIEAISCGVPVLSADCDYGPREVLAPGTDLNVKARSFEKCQYGYLLPPFGEEDIDTTITISDLEKEMGNAIVSILSMKEENAELVDNGLEYVKRFDNAKYADQWLDVMEKLL